MTEHAGPQNLLIFGNGYSGGAIAQAALSANIPTTITSRTPSSAPNVIAFGDAAPALAAATHIIVTAAPDEQGDPVLARYGHEIAASPNLIYIGYLSTTGVYGDHNGAWVDEDTQPTPQSPRTQHRLAAEHAWSAIASAQMSGGKQSIFPATKTLDIFRLAGIYGPGRSMFDDLRTGTARHVVKPGHLFGRIHRDDIAQGVLKALQRNAPPGINIFNFSDDEPAASADVVVEAARLLNVPPPAPVPYEAAVQAMSPMARSFWSENRRVANTKTKLALNLTWRYPTYREGLTAILKEEQENLLFVNKKKQKNFDFFGVAIKFFLENALAAG